MVKCRVAEVTFAVQNLNLKVQFKGENVKTNNFHQALT